MFACLTLKERAARAANPMSNLHQCKGRSARNECRRGWGDTAISAEGERIQRASQAGGAPQIQLLQRQTADFVAQVHAGDWNGDVAGLAGQRGSDCIKQERGRGLEQQQPRSGV